MLALEGSWLDIDALLSMVCSPSLYILVVKPYEYGESASQLAMGGTRCFQTIASRHSSITSLSVSRMHRRFPPRTGCVIRTPRPVTGTVDGQLMDILHPLLSLCQLRHLSLVFPTYFNLACTLSDHLLMAESWPNLGELHLVWRTPVARDQPVDTPRGGPLHGLAHFARGCPRLRVLHLSAMEMSEEAAEGPDYPCRPHGLRTLIIPQVHFPPGRDDLSGRLSETLQRFFPLVASVFRPERLVMKGHVALVPGATSCPDCTH